jgi:3-oxoacyl-[acyl-carrier protein] reductase
MNRERETQLPLNEILSFNKRTVLITGAASGMGQAMAKRFDEGGADLVLLDINQSGLEKTLNQLQRKEFHTIYRVDLSSKDEIDEFWHNLSCTPDTIINNAGVYPEQDFLKISQEDFHKTQRINLESAVWMCQNFINLREKHGGTIVNISSIEAILPFKRDLIPYGISKGGVVNLTRGLARDYGRDGYKINAILPGAIKTPGTRSMVEKAIKNLRFDLISTGIVFAQRLPKRRWGNPDEVAKVATFLSSDLSSYMQGALIPVDGGFLSS